MIKLLKRKIHRQLTEIEDLFVMSKGFRLISDKFSQSVEYKWVSIDTF